MLIENVEIEGFGSIGELTLNLNTGFITLVKGANGSGKSTMFNALFWALYGSNLKGGAVADVATKEEFRSEDFKGTRVIVRANKNGQEIIIARHLNYKGLTFGVSGGSNLMIQIDGQIQNIRTKDETQKEITRLIGVEENVFLNSVLFGQRMKRFIESSPNEKRETFESIFDFEYIELMKAKCKTKLDNLNTELSNIATSVQNIESEITLTHREIELQKEFIESKTKDLENSKNSVESELKAIEDYISKIEIHDEPDKLPYDYELDSKVIHLKAALSNRPNFDTTAKEAQVKKLQEDIANFKLETIPDFEDVPESVNDQYQAASLELSKSKYQLENLNPPVEPTTVCPTCEQSLSKEKVKDLKTKYEDDLKEYEQTKEKLSLNIELNAKLVSELNELEAKRKNIISQNAEIQKLKDSQAKQLSEKESIERRLVDLKEDLQRMLEDATKEVEIVEKLKSDLSVLEAEQVKNNNAKSHNDTVDKLIRENESSLRLRESKMTDKVRLEEKLTELKNTKITDNTESLLSKEVTLFNDREKEWEKQSKVEKDIEIFTWWGKDALSYSGIKSYVINSALQALNQAIYKYSSRLGISIHFSIDTSKPSKPFVTTCTMQGVELNYNDFSGGEKVRIDVATAFAIHDIVSQQTNINILIMDEIFEGLDENGTQDIFDLIRIKSEGRSVFIITHLATIDILYTKVMTILKDPLTKIQ